MVLVLGTDRPVAGHNMAVVDSMAAQVGSKLVEVGEVDKVLDTDTCVVCKVAIWALWAARGRGSRAPGIAGTLGNIYTEDTACRAPAGGSTADSTGMAVDMSTCKAPYHKAILLDSFDPCVCSGQPCGACYPYSTKPCVASCNDLRPCSVCPGGGCSPCPAPVRPCPAPCPPCPVLPCLPPCPPCDKPMTPVPKPVPLCETVAIPCCRPNRCKPCPCYCCTEPGICTPKRCSYPGVPVCGCGCCGPCMPVW